MILEVAGERKNFRVYCSIILVICLTQLSCGGRQSQTPSPVTEIDNGQPLLKYVSVQCGSSLEDCSPSVGMLAFKLGNAGGICTGFLTDGGYFATNDHCIPAELATGSSCHDSIEILFPHTSGYQAERVRCDQIAWRSGDGQEYNPLVIDTAFLKLSKIVQRPILKFSHSGVENHALVQVFKVNPDKSNYGFITGTLESQRCRVIQKSYLYPSLDGRSSLGFILTSPYDDSCEIVSGNSGSPVIGSDGEVHGIVHHSNRAGAGDSAQLLKEFLFIFFGDQKAVMDRPIAVATNFSCVKNPTDEGYIAPAECANSLSPLHKEEKSKEIDQQILKKLFNQLNDIAKKWGHDDFPMFDWKMGTLKTGVITKTDIFVPIPYCTRPVGLDEPKYRGRFLGVGYRDVYEGKEIVWPTYFAEYEGLDEDLLPDLEIKKSSESQFYDLQFSPSSIMSHKPTAVIIRGQGLIFSTNIINETLKPCP